MDALAHEVCDSGGCSPSSSVGFDSCLQAQLLRVNYEHVQTEFGHFASQQVTDPRLRCLQDLFQLTLGITGRRFHNLRMQISLQFPSMPPASGNKPALDVRLRVKILYSRKY